MTSWRSADPTEADAPITRLGGQPSWTGTPRWPTYQGQPLPFLGQIAFLEGRIVLVFMSDDPDTAPWQPSDGGNAAIIEPNGDLPPWVTPDARSTGPTALPGNPLVPDQPLQLHGQPDWLQYDETPDDTAQFLYQLDSFIDPDGYLTFGDGGTAYLFVSPDHRQARILWQS